MIFVLTISVLSTMKARLQDNGAREGNVHTIGIEKSRTLCGVNKVLRVYTFKLPMHKRPST